MEATLIEKGTRTAIRTTVSHKHFKYLPKDAFKLLPRVPCHSSKTRLISHSQRSSSPQPGEAGCLLRLPATDAELAWTRATCRPAPVRPRALVPPEGPDKKDVASVRSSESLQYEATCLKCGALHSCSAGQRQSQGTAVPSEPCSLHRTSELLGLNWFGKNRSCSSHYHQ